jgi:hypothetical protein
MYDTYYGQKQGEQMSMLKTPKMWPNPFFVNQYVTFTVEKVAKIYGLLLY